MFSGRLVATSEPVHACRPPIFAEQKRVIYLAQSKIELLFDAFKPCAQ